MRKHMIRISIVNLFIVLFLTTMVSAQENSWSTWTGLELSKSINKKLEVSLSPEIRFSDQFKLDEYFIEASLQYKLLKFLEIGGNYRFLVNERETKSTEYFHRFALDAKGKYKYLKMIAPEMVKRAKLGYIASIIGVTQETLSRIRRD